MSKSNLQKSQPAVWGNTIERTAKRMKQVYKRLLKEAGVGITVDQWVVLQLLRDRDGLSQLEIAERTDKDAPTITRIIDLLVRKGLCKRQPDPRDRRRFSIRLTAAGRAKIQEVSPVARAFRRRGWEGVSEVDLEQLMQTLNRIYQNLSKDT
ncbi:MAG: MarR family winged helix-turn-helix transcriptional regulator [Bacteroidota bacterium]